MYTRLLESLLKAVCSSFDGRDMLGKGICDGCDMLGNGVFDGRDMLGIGVCDGRYCTETPLLKASRRFK
jgi:hypothetical protein